jgi:hypothetical protein
VGALSLANLVALAAGQRRRAACQMPRRIKQTITTGSLSRAHGKGQGTEWH